MPALAALRAEPRVLLALALMGVIVMMVLPVPAWLLDIGLAASFALAILIFTLALFVERPLDFSAFPSILLGALMLRLALNVSSTRLILSRGHEGTDAAGQVIEGFAMFVMGGQPLLGVVVFGVLLIVNFVVINKGAARMAEVGARFALDAMPGRQLAIDADLASGAITHEEAKARREREGQETTFFGSLDGASKFVKGDAVAGLLITALNLVMGLVMGTAVHGLPLSDALRTYAVLTVGDGLVSQIPAVIIAVGAALLLAHGGARERMDAAVLGQLGRHPAALGAVAGLMALFAVLPGMPFAPFLAGSALLGTLAWRAAARLSAPLPPAAEPPGLRPGSLGDLLDLDEIHVEFAPDLVEVVLDPATGLDIRIGTMRRHVAQGYGLILPEIRLTDSAALPAGQYRIRIQGAEAARDTVRPGHLLVLMAGGAAPAGDDVREPVYGAPARWIPSAAGEEAALAGLTVVGPAEVLATHLLEVVRGNLGRLMTLRALRRLLDEMTNLSDPARAAANRRLLDELIPERVPPDLLLAVLRLLLEERVSIRNLPLILEATAEGRSLHATAEGVLEHVRARLGFQLVAELRRADGTLPLIQLDPGWEEVFAAHQIGPPAGPSDVALPPDAFNRLAAAIAEVVARAAEGGISPALVTSQRRRRFLRTVLASRAIPSPVLSFEEIGPEARPALVGTVPA
ncbi:flagellar biosynthesis protein FlhA [Rubellimicrobium sp. CFH 75288]|uniref:flagellar biosynthesis protein FlhA n=1 Tax=Rubellimicrobium sp. CFH 75288 TaxID=2697034 RepID=UPI0014128D58|nr:flagellar biosynthesis protein FlhA [Rubellimicrobium sp. CFH 75288]NAZ37284.1 flagellar type III secretion system protein FlhA [Rubellimicrobium sp. CFH 75288]